jgi:hypothetical protein
MDMIKYAAVCAAAVALVTACEAGGSRDAAPSGQAVAPFSTSESVSLCSSATADVLKSAAQRQREALSHPFTVRQVRCSGDWAFALISMKGPPETNPPSMVLFHNDGGSWRVVTYGSGFDCTNRGVPPTIAAEIEC